jgi:hypothetical protein
VRIRPPTAGAATIAALALETAQAALHATQLAGFCDTRVDTLQRVWAPIAHLDVMDPFLLTPQAIIPVAGDPGAYATNSALEDR